MNHGNAMKDGASRSRASLRLTNAIALVVALAACGRNPTEPDPNPFLRQFDTFWTAFDRNYSYFVYKNINWDSLRTVYRPQAGSVQTQAALIDVLRAMVAPMRDLHIWFRDPASRTIPTYTPAHTLNWKRENWAAHVASAGWVQETTNLGSARFGEVGYIAIGGWNTTHFSSADVDEILDRLRTSTALIVDVRPNGGGNDGLAYQVAGRFTPTSVLAEYVQFRAGPDHDDFTPLTPKQLDPRGPWQYTGPVVLLIGRGCYSSNESFISAMRELPNVTVMGDTTGGSSGNPGFFDLDDGWSFGVPRWIAYTADRRVIEWNGIAPDIVVAVTAAQLEGNTDPVISAALDWLRNHR